MNFFSEQDEARRNTKWLVVFFILAVITLIIITNILVAVCLWFMDGQLTNSSWAASLAIDTHNASQHPSLLHFFNGAGFVKVGLWVCGTIGCVIIFKWLQLRAGGKKVAESLGGSRINTNTNDSDEKRVLNVVEEMALASGMPVPSVYVLKNEKGINAFAAGHTPADAVIGITQGALDQFDRDQLQGVVAHEFSHILNGDMRLNLHLIAMLSGIVFIANVGRMIMHAGGGGYGRCGSRRSGDARVMFAGIGLLIIGWLGSFFASLIKAAISRQREFLADASAVQFTRNPDGIADALKIIGGYKNGSRVFSTKAIETSHLFLSNAVGIHSMFATHPPLELRIAKLQPQWNGEMISRAVKVVERPQPKFKKNPESFQQDQNIKRQQQAAMAATAGAAFVINNKRKRQSMADADFSYNTKTDDSYQETISTIDELVQQARDPFGASALVYSLLLSSDKHVQEKQLNYIQANQIPGLVLQTLDLFSKIIHIQEEQRLLLLEATLPALKMMSATQYKNFKKTLLLLMRADYQFELFEWCLFHIVRHYLAPEFESTRTSKISHYNISSISADFKVILSALAHHGHDSSENAYKAFNYGKNTSELYNIAIMDKANIQIDNLSKAASKLSHCTPLLKPKLLKGLAACAAYDKKITSQEKEIITALAAIMNCPMPRLVI